MKEKIEQVVGTYKKYGHYGFLIPTDREAYGGDFYVQEKDSMEAETGDYVEGVILDKSAGKKPQAKIKKVGDKPKPYKFMPQKIVGVFAKHNGDFGFIDIIGKDKGFFVFGKDINGAVDGDKVEATTKKYKGKEEAVITKVLEYSEEELIEGEYKEVGSFGFVIPDDKTKNPNDIFIAFVKKGGAKTGDRVACAITRMAKKNPEGIIKKIL